MPEKPSLDAAYGLQTPDDNLKLYADWAGTYDTNFAGDHGYVLPAQVVGVFETTGCKGRLLDVGAGTGLVGEHLNHLGHSSIDGTDISTEMLNVAAEKNIYENLIEGDLTATLPIDDNTYDGLLSAGTFTLGHVGPDAFDELLRIAKPGATFALSINDAHFGPAGFDAKFQALADQITNLKLEPIQIYASWASGPHANDTGVVAVFEKRMT